MPSNGAMLLLCGRGLIAPWLFTFFDAASRCRPFCNGDGNTHRLTAANDSCFQRLSDRRAPEGILQLQDVAGRFTVQQYKNVS